jgi:hypothetical protein
VSLILIISRHLLIHHPYRSLPRALVDRHDVVMAVIAPGPKGLESWWQSIVGLATKDLGRFYRYGEFGHLGEGESLVRFGIQIGYPFDVSNSFRFPLGDSSPAVILGPVRRRKFGDQRARNQSYPGEHPVQGDV